MAGRRVWTGQAQGWLQPHLTTSGKSHVMIAVKEMGARNAFA